MGKCADVKISAKLALVLNVGERKNGTPPGGRGSKALGV
jgi:hypothetical protein